MSAKPEMDAADFFAAERLKWKEKTFQKEVLALARDYGWDYRYHSYFSDRSEAGFPDAVLIRSSTAEMIFVEFKTMKGRISLKQEAWLEAFATVERRGIDLAANKVHPLVRAYLWRPCCWNSGEIDRALR